MRKNTFKALLWACSALACCASAQSENVRYIPVYNSDQPNRIVYDLRKPLIENVSTSQNLSSTLVLMYKLFWERLTYGVKYTENEISTSGVLERGRGICLEYCALAEEELRRLGYNAETIVLKGSKVSHSMVLIRFKNRFLVFDPLNGRMNESKDLCSAVKNCYGREVNERVRVIRFAREDELRPEELQILRDNRDTKEEMQRLVERFTIAEIDL